MQVPERIHSAIDALRAEFGDAPVDWETEPYESPPGNFERLVDAAAAGTIDSSYVWVRRKPAQFPTPARPPDATSPGQERVLLIYDRFDDHAWSAPGGAREPSESFAAAARRELAEETGIEASLVGLRKLQHRVAVPAADVADPEREEIHALYPLFDAEYDGGDLDVQESELYGAAWFDRLPDDAHELVADQTVGER